jgi:hypothetical protein
VVERYILFCYDIVKRFLTVVAHGHDGHTPTIIESYEYTYQWHLILSLINRSKLNYVVVGLYSTSDLNETEGEGNSIIRSERIPIAGLYPNPKWIFDDYAFDQLIVKLAFDSTIAPIVVNFDPTIPELDTNLTLIGFGKFSNGPFNPDTLQETEVSYIDNDECKLFENESGELPYSDRITDDMICIYGDGLSGQCSGDSGGPYIIKGESANDDIQVGMVSWSSGGACDGDQPGVGARTSVYEWIQTITCQHATDLSSSNFDCNGDDTFSPAPTKAPSLPTVSSSPAPTLPSATVTFSIYFDDHPEEIAWSIVGTEDEVTYGEVPYFFYPQGTPIVRETLLLPPGNYSLQIEDSYGDGISNSSPDNVAFDVILSDEGRDMKFILIQEDGVFRTIRSTSFTVPTVDEYPTEVPSSSPTVSVSPSQRLIIVYLTIHLDEWSKEIAWSITDGDNPDIVFAEVLPGTYISGPSRTVTEKVQLPFGGEYILTVEDNFGDGLEVDETTDGADPTGFFLWVAEPGTRDQIVLLEGSADFEVEISFNFTLSEEAVGLANR